MSPSGRPKGEYRSAQHEGSPVTRLALLRHGETDWNLQSRIQGRTDTELHDQARAWLVGRRLPQEFNGWRRFSSPLRRCLQTCECLGLSNVQVQPSLVEADWGQWEGCTLAQLRGEHAQTMRENEALGFDFRPSGGESPREVLVRLRPWLHELAQTGEPALAVTHRGVIRVLMAQALGWDMLGKAPVKLQRNAMHVFQIQPDGSVRPDQFNIPLESRSQESP